MQTLLTKKQIRNYILIYIDENLERIDIEAINKLISKVNFNVCAKSKYETLNKDFNIKRLERYVVLAKSSGAEVVIVLTKCDLCEEYEEIISQCMEYFEGIKTIAISVVTDVGISELRQQFNGNKVGLLIGSSGVGKSSLVNKLCMRQVMNTGEIRQDDDRGKHTTVSRHMIYFDEGIIVDTPGLREIGIVESAESIKDVYNDIETIGSYCKFNNCTHTSEKGCAVLEEIRKGNLSLDRYQNYLKIRKENDLLSDRDKYLYDKWQKSKERSNCTERQIWHSLRGKLVHSPTPRPIGKTSSSCRPNSAPNEHEIPAHESISGDKRSIIHRQVNQFHLWPSILSSIFRKCPPHARAAWV